MGSGKSALGCELAAKLKYDFVDIDQMIELKRNETINHIFEKHGEETFRDIEKEVLHQTIDFKNTIIATGGGTPCYSDNMEWMNEQGLTIYLNVSLGKLFHRLAVSKEDRPLIKDKPDLELMEYMKKNIVKREVFYNDAKLIIEDDNLTMDKLFNQIQKEINYSK